MTWQWAFGIPFHILQQKAKNDVPEVISGVPLLDSLFVFRIIYFFLFIKILGHFFLYGLGCSSFFNPLALENVFPLKMDMVIILCFEKRIFSFLDNMLLTLLQRVMERLPLMIPICLNIYSICFGYSLFTYRNHYLEIHG
jgi:hypothetical protein